MTKGLTREDAKGEGGMGAGDDLERRSIGK